jgi:hypothetical protein
MQATCKLHEKHGDLTERSDLPDSVDAVGQRDAEPAEKGPRAIRRVRSGATGARTSSRAPRERPRYA